MKNMRAKREPFRLLRRYIPFHAVGVFNKEFTLRSGNQYFIPGFSGKDIRRTNTRRNIFKMPGRSVPWRCGNSDIQHDDVALQQDGWPWNMPGRFRVLFIFRSHILFLSHSSRNCSSTSISLKVISYAAHQSVYSLLI